MRLLTIVTGLLFMEAAAFAQMIPFAYKAAKFSGSEITCFNNNIYGVDATTTAAYVVGYFTHAGPCSGRGLKVDSNGATVGSLTDLAKINGAVRAALPDGSGGFYIGGDFTRIGATYRRSLARINADGSLHPWKPDTPRGSVHSMLIDGSSLYIGGNFDGFNRSSSYGTVMDVATGHVDIATDSDIDGWVYAAIPDGESGWYIGGKFDKAGGYKRHGLARILRDGQVDPNFKAHFNDRVRSLYLDGTTLYVGGDFEYVNGERRAGITAIDTVTSALLPFDGKTCNVQAIAKMGNDLLIGGDFSSVGADVACSSGVAVDAATGAIDANFPVIDNSTTNFSAAASSSVNAVLPDGSGGFYVAGLFTKAGLETRNGIVHLDSSGNILPLNIGVTGGSAPMVYAMLKIGNTLYVGGDFTQINGTARNRLGAVDLSTGALTTWNPNVSTASSQVRALATDGTDIFVGGTFTTIGGQPRNRIASVPIASSTPTAWNPGADNSVYTLDASTSVIYAGGLFTNIGGQARSRIAALDKATGLATSWNPNASSTVFSIQVSGSTVYAGGLFSTIGGQIRNRVAALSDSTALATAWNPNVDNVVYALLLNGSTIYAGGQFDFVGGIPRSKAAEIDLTTGLPTAWNPNLTGLVYGLAVSGSKVFIGGMNSDGAGGTPRDNIAAIDATTAAVNPTWIPNASNPVRTIVNDGGRIFVGGSFFVVGGQSRNRIAELNTTTGAATAWYPATGASGDVDYILPDPSGLYVGGRFTSMGGVLRNYAAQVDKNTAVTTGWNPNTGAASAFVYYMQKYGSSIYMVGNFTTIGGQARKNIGVVDATTGAVTSWDVNANGSPYVLSINGDKMYSGGVSYEQGGVLRAGIAKLDLVTGVLDTAFNANVGIGTVVKLAKAGTNLYAVGNFTTVGGQGRNRAAAVDLTTGAVQPWNPNLNNLPYSFQIDTVGSRAFIGGAFTTVGGTARNYLASVNLTDGALDTSFDALIATIASGAVNAIEPNADFSKLTVGGLFSTVNGQSRSRLVEVDAATGAYTAWNPNANNVVYAVRRVGTQIYVGGDFTSVGGQSRNRAAVVDDTTAAVGAFNPGAGAAVRLIEPAGSDLFIGGDFTFLQAQARNGAAAVDLATGALTAWNPNANSNFIESVLISGSTVYLGGMFTNIGGQMRNYLAAVDATTGLATGWNASVTGGLMVQGLDLVGTTLYVAGWFSGIGGQSRSYLGAVNTTTGLATSWNPNAGSAASRVKVVGSKAYVMGSFTTVGGQTRRYLAATDATTGAVLPWDPSPESTPNSLVASGTTLYVLGSTGTIAGATRNGIAAFDTGSDTLLPFFPNIEATSVSTLVFDGDNMYVGGGISSMNDDIRVGAGAMSFASGDTLSWAPRLAGAASHMKVSGSYVIMGGNLTRIGDEPVAGFAIFPKH